MAWSLYLIIKTSTMKGYMEEELREGRHKIVV
jgi:hypothetical protein